MIDENILLLAPLYIQSLKMESAFFSRFLICLIRFRRHTSLNFFNLFTCITELVYFDYSACSVQPHVNLVTVNAAIDKASNREFAPEN